MKIDPPVSLSEASQWFALLAADHVSEKDRQAWQSWLNANPENAKAWQQIEAVNSRFSTVTGALGYETLKLPNPGRRLAMKHIVMFGSVGLTSLYVYREQPWQGMLADVSTKVGQQQRMQLADGTQLHINTDSAVNVVYNDTLRLVELLHGEIHIQTAHDSYKRAFKVKTQHGYVTALGTRFNVRDHGEYTQVSLFEGHVQINPQKEAQLQTVIDAGQSIRFDKKTIHASGESRFADEAWVKGKLMFNETPLEQVVKELSRYRPGVLRCSPQVAQLKISGVLPTDDSAEALRLLTQSFPLRVEQFTPYWTTITTSR